MPENYFMKKIFLFLLPVLLVTACDDKEIIVQPPPQSHPPMKYTSLNNVAIKFGQQKSLDIDGDHTVDLLFSSILVGDPILRRDRRQYYVNAAFNVYSLVNGQEQTPRLESGDPILVVDHPGFNWFNASSIMLAEKIIEETGPAHWEGNWKDAAHGYMPVQIRKNDLVYNGWVEMSFNTNTEELILHRAAICSEAGKNIKAGQ